jgi:multimeric flavodoxin WrbA
MKIVAINGSPTGSNGTTGKVLAALIEGAEKEGAEVRLFELGAGTVKPCISCHTCQKEGYCVIEDDLQAIHKAMLEADGLVLGTPNYIDDVSAQLKALLDRSFSMYHCQMLNGKYGACVVASGGPRYERVEEYLMDKIGNIGCWKVGSMVAAGGLIQDPEYAPAIEEEARELGRTLARAIATQTTFPEQIDARHDCFEVMRWLVEDQKEEWPFEYQYWQTHWKDTIIKPE